jgi:small subunit ribosomal protein S1
VETVILRLDPAERKISLSLKQVTPSPFTQFAADHQPGDVLEGEITNVVGYGAFVKLSEQVEGLMHISEIAWTPVRNIDETLHVGDKVNVRILHINHDTEKIALSGRLGEPPASEAGDASPMRDRAPRGKGGRRPPRRDKESDEQRYITDVASFATKLGERFPKELLDRMKAQKSE